MNGLIKFKRIYIFADNKTHMHLFEICRVAEDVNKNTKRLKEIYISRNRALKFVVTHVKSYDDQLKLTMGMNMKAEILHF